ncbi:MAG: hypothetical protein R2800_02275 [Flavipsychrobacter sp.]
MENLYCISGLGADERIFKKLQIDNVNMVHIPWPEYDVYDEMGCYAQKIAALIPEENPMVLGLSFGGMMTIELTKLMPLKKAIIVSSAKTKAELQPPSWIVKKALVSQILPSFIYKMTNSVMYNMFGAHTEEEKELLKSILKDSDGYFVRWAMKSILEWQNMTLPQDVTHIHGTADQIIPPDKIEASYWIEGGTHMMVYNRAKEISEIINKEISYLL